jgi:beta-galactosidase
MKKVYEPFRATYENGEMTVKSVRYFTSLSDLSLKWKLTSNEKVIAEGEIDTLEIAPQGSVTYKLFDEGAYDLSGDCFVTATIHQKNDTPWAEKGYEIGFLQFEIETEKEVAAKDGNAVELNETDRYAVITCCDVEYTFDKPYGRLSSIKKDGKEYLEAPVKFKMWHAPAYNRGSVDEWVANHLDHIAQKTYSTEVEEGNNKVIIVSKIALGGPANPPILKGKLTHIFHGDGSVDIALSGDIRENAPLIPRLGLELLMNEEFENIRYFGLGETETYPDRYKAGRFGDYELTVTDNFVHYIRPQENSSHFKTRRVAVGKKGGNALFVTGSMGAEEFSFNASHYSAEQLTEKKHDFELEKEPYTIFNIDARFNALSEEETLNNDENNRLFDEKSVSFCFNIKPIEM